MLCVRLRALRSKSSTVVGRTPGSSRNKWEAAAVYSTYIIVIKEYTGIGAGRNA